MVRIRYSATQVIWECKNYSDLASNDFHQISYYMSSALGGLGIVTFRGIVKPHHFGHIKRIADVKSGNAIVLLLTDRDLDIFLRQAINGKVKDTHIQELYDQAIRKIS